MEHRPAFGIHRRFPKLLGIHLAEALVALHGRVVPADFVELLRQLVVAVGVPVLLALANLVERRLRDVDVAALNERLHVAVEEGQEERADMRSVDVGIGHDDDLAVATLRDVKVVADARAERRDHRADLGIGEDLVKTRFLDVQDLAAQGQDCLEAAVTSLLRRAAGAVALDEVDFRLLGIFDRAVRELSGQARHFERILAPCQLTRLSRGFPRARRHDRLLDDLLRDGGIFLEILGQSLGHDGIDNAAHLGIAELRLRLPLELRLMNLETDDAGQALSDILAREIAVLVLQYALLSREVVRRPRQSDLESREMRAALLSVDIVDKAVDILHVAVVVLHGDFHNGIILDTIEVDRRRMNDFLLAVQMLDEGADAALIEVRLLAPLAALVHEADRDALIQKGQLAQAMLQGIEAILRHREDLRVGDEVNLRSRLFRLADDRQRSGCHALLETYAVDLAVALDFDVHRRGERIDDGDADTVQTARHLVAFAAELAARVQDGQDDLDRRLAALVHVDGDASPIVDDGDAVVLFDRHVNMVAIAGQSLIDRVVDHLVDEMMQAALRRAADIHARALSYSFQAFQNLNLIGAVVAVNRRDVGAVHILVNLDIFQIKVIVAHFLGKLRRFLFAQLLLGRILLGTVERFLERILLFFHLYIVPPSFLKTSMPALQNHASSFHKRAIVCAFSRTARKSPRNKALHP